MTLNIHSMAEDNNSPAGMQTGGRQAWIEEQLHSEGIHAVAFQEGRASQAATRNGEHYRKIVASGISGHWEHSYGSLWN